MKEINDLVGSDAYIDETHTHDQDNREESTDGKPGVVARQPWGCTRFITVEPAVFGTMFILTLYNIMSKEYFYQRIASEYNFTQSNTTEPSCRDVKDNISDPDYELHQKVSAETSSLSLYLGVATFVPELFANIIYGSWGDRVGRKPPINISLFGFVILFSCYLVVIIFNLPLHFLLIGHISSGLLGDFGNLLGCSFSYLSDITSPEQRTLRMAVLETGIGTGSFVASMTSGLWNVSSGFQSPYWFMLGLAVFNFLYSVCFLPPNNEGKPRPTFG